ncbi:MAG: aminoacyl-tRNA hydrolase [Alphaproteobacteria bacterium]|nr:MAG: aminoacyl-tRNA hydrolase [Alphaproteobacteria bacterium]
MQIFVGLGNPGPKHAGQRHNIGFMAVERIAADHGFQPWRKRFEGETSEGRLGAEKVLLLKPMTFMNLSGRSVAAALRFYKLGTGALTVFHDELDLAPGKVRVKQGGGHAGHNGLRSLSQHVGADFRRVRIGIGHPGDKARVTGHVLGDFAKSDRDWLEAVLQGISEGAVALAEGQTDRFLNAVALRTAPPRSSGGKAVKPAGKAEGRDALRASDPAPDGSGNNDAPRADESPLARLLRRFGK